MFPGCLYQPVFCSELLPGAAGTAPWVLPWRLLLPPKPQRSGFGRQSLTVAYNFCLGAEASNGCLWSFLSLLSGRTSMI